MQRAFSHIFSSFSEALLELVPFLSGNVDQCCVWPSWNRAQRSVNTQRCRKWEGAGVSAEEIANVSRHGCAGNVTVHYILLCSFGVKNT